MLRNSHVKELKALDKELKKKKGVLREQLDIQREEILKRHERELSELAASHGADVAKPSTNQSAVTKSAVKESEGANTSNKDALPYFYPELNWASMSKKELEVEAHNRGLGKKGNREELITKLMVFQTDQRAKVESGQLDPTRLPPAPASRERSAFKRAGVAYAASRTDNTGDVAQFLKTPAKATDNAESSSSDEDEDDDEETTAAAGGASELQGGDREQKKEGDDSSEASESDSDDDIPDTQKQMGSSKHDFRGAHRRRHERTHRGGRGARRGGDHMGRGARSAPAEPTEEQRQQKREKVMQQVLLKLVAKHPHGLHLDHILFELKALKVSNFQPSLLGYSSVMEWIDRQPSSILHYDSSEQKIYPPRDTLYPEDSADDE